jgi:hypothetical protein
MCFVSDHSYPHESSQSKVVFYIINSITDSIEITYEVK